jgi:hypothetical protein
MKTQAQTVTDYDGNVYDTVVIGNQVWLKQNLKTTHDNTGTLIPNVADSAAWANLSSWGRCYYNNDSAAYDSVYGPLYNWYVANNSNVCPLGWHVASNAEWQAAETFLGGANVAGGKMKLILFIGLVPTPLQQTAVALQDFPLVVAPIPAVFNLSAKTASGGLRLHTIHLMPGGYTCGI